MPTPEENKELTERFNDEVFNKHNVDYLQESLSDDFVEHSPLPGFGQDKQGAVDTINALLTFSSDMRIETVRTVASGDRVGIQTVTTGTDTGGLLPGMPATNKPFSMGAMDIVAIGDDGKFTHHWGIYDVMGVMGQLGLLPGPGGAPTPE